MVVPVGSQLRGQQLQQVVKHADATLRMLRATAVRFVSFTRDESVSNAVD